MADLQRLSGFDRRTIVYYIQAGLLPKVGRRGPHTRYPAEALERLQIIRALRSHQERGDFLNTTLKEIRAALNRGEPGRYRELLASGPDVAALAAFLEPPPPAAVPTPPRPAGEFVERRAFGLADANIRRMPPPVREIPPRSPVAGDKDWDAADLGELLRQLEVRPTLHGPRKGPGASEHWTQVPVTGRVFLAVRGLNEEDAPLAEAVARILKRAIRQSFQG